MTGRSVILGVSLFLPIVGISFLYLIFEGTNPTFSLLEIFLVYIPIGCSCFILPTILVINSVGLIKEGRKKKILVKVAKVFFSISILSILTVFLFFLWVSNIRG